MLRRAALALIVWFVAASAATAAESYRGAGRDMIVDFDAGRAAPAPVAPSSAYARPGAGAPAAAPLQAPAPSPSGVPTSVEGNAVAPNSIEGYNSPQSRRMADISAPQPLPPRFPSAVPPAPAPASPYMAPVVARPAVAKPARVKRAAAPKRKGEVAAAEAPAPDEEKNEVPKPEAQHHVAVDVSTGMTTRRSLVVTTGVTAAVGGPLEKSGVRVHAEWMGLWSCCLGAAPKDSPLPQGVQLSNAALIGYEFVGEKGTMTGYVGIDVQNTPNALEDLPSHRSTRVGLQVSGDAYYTPTDSTMMSTNVSFSTNKLAYFMRTKFGVAIADDLYVGPEVGAIGSKQNQQYRLGAHISGVKLGHLTFGFAAGYAYNRKAGPGAYAILDSRIVF